MRTTTRTRILSKTNITIVLGIVVLAIALGTMKHFAFAPLKTYQDNTTPQWVKQVKITETPKSKLFTEGCFKNSDCVSNKCYVGVCARGDSQEGTSCTLVGFEDECDYGFYCGSSGAGGVCSLKKSDDDVCTSGLECISGVCQNNKCTTDQNVFSLCGIVNDGSPYNQQVNDHYIKETIAKSSDMMFERTGRRFRILLPIERINDSTLTTDIFHNNPIYRQWILNCLQHHPTDTPNGAFIYAGDPFLYVVNPMAGAMTLASDDLTNFAYWNRYPNPHLGVGFIPAANVKQIRTGADAVGIFHELLHTYDGDGADVHEGTNTCNNLLGKRLDDANMLGLSFSAIGWGSICAHTFVNFATMDRPTVSPSGNNGLIGRRCANNSDCLSGLCEFIPSGTVPPGATPYKICMKRNLRIGELCLADSQCANGSACLGLRCSRTVSASLTNAPLYSLCTSNAQCQSGLCFGSRCFSKLTGGVRCNAAVECQSGVCDNFACGCNQDSECNVGTICVNHQCVMHNLTPGANCINTRQCSSGYACINRQCFPTNLPYGDYCLDNVQCQSGICLLGSAGTCGCQNSNECPSGFLCQNNMCKAPRGSVCTLARECQSGICAGFRCQNPCGSSGQCPAGERCGQADSTPNVCLQLNLPNGSYCNQSWQCQSNHCDGNYRCV